MDRGSADATEMRRRVMEIGRQAEAENLVLMELREAERGRAPERQLRRVAALEAGLDGVREAAEAHARREASEAAARMEALPF